MLILVYQRLFLFSRFLKWPTRIHYLLSILLVVCRNHYIPKYLFIIRYSLKIINPFLFFNFLQYIQYKVSFYIFHHSLIHTQQQIYFQFQNMYNLFFIGTVLRSFYLKRTQIFKFLGFFFYLNNCINNLELIQNLQYLL